MRLPLAPCRQPTPLPAPPQPGQPAPFGCPADNAVNELRKKGMAAANKKASRHAAEGLVGLAKGDAVAAVVEVRRRQGCAWAHLCWPILMNGTPAHVFSSPMCPSLRRVPARPRSCLPACRSTAKPILWPATNSSTAWWAAQRQQPWG